MKTKLSYKEQREFEILPKEIEELEKKLDDIRNCLNDPVCYQEKGLKELTTALEEAQMSYDQKSEKYLELWELVESLNG